MAGESSEAGERSVGLLVRLTPDEREGWHAAARVAGWGKTAGWVREVVAERISGPKGASSSRAAVLQQQVGRVRAELVRIGVNLNQVAFQVNAGAVAGSPVEVEVVRRELAAVRAELGALRNAVEALVDASSVAASEGASERVPAATGESAGPHADAARVAAARAEVARLEALRAQITARAVSRGGARNDDRGGVR